jgi:predicted  nucleic acid-binding Zn-ribbon protein
MLTAKSLETELAIVKNEIGQIGHLFSKLEITLEKITNVSTNVSQILAVHERRLHETDLQFESVKNRMEIGDGRVKEDIKDLHSRVSSTSREVEEKMTREIEKVLNAIQDLKTHMLEKDNKLEERIETLERWRWIMVGILIAAGAFLPEIRNFLISFA